MSRAIVPPNQLTIGPAKPMTEAELQRAVIAQARSLGWGVTQSAAEKLHQEAVAYGIEPPPLDGLVFHPRYSLGSEPGWPDLTLVRRRDRRLIFAELKGEKGRLKPRQEAVLELLRCLMWGPNVDRAMVSEPAIRAYSPAIGDAHDAVHPGTPIGPSVEVYVWRPSDLADGTIEGVLR